jgi:methylmalonyl-CoA mutase C-terminal domain/subunit
MDRKTRVLVAKPGLDGHDLGARLVCRLLRDAGAEVIYTGLRQSVEAIVNSAIQEDVDVVGLSILSGAHLGLTGKVMDALERAGAGDKKVVVGGLILKGDDRKLKDMGVAEVFTAHTPHEKIKEYFRKLKTEE